MTVLNQFWQRSDKSVVVDKIKKTLTIPSFGSLSCGKEHGSLFYGWDAFSTTFATFNKTSLTAITSTLTAEIWFKPLRFGGIAGGPSTILEANNGGDSLYIIELFDFPADPTSDSCIRVKVQNSGTTVYTFLSAVNTVEWEQWQCISFTFDSTANRLKVYLNGILLGSTVTTGTISGSGVRNHSIGGVNGGVSYVGYIGDVRIWNQVLTSEEVLQRYNKPRGIDGIIDPLLKAYFRFTELVGLTLTSALGNAIVAPISSSVTWSTTEKAPIIFGASFIVASYHVTLDQDFSFRFPVSKPTTDCNFELHCSWTDRHGTFQRRKFWAVSGVDIAPEVAIYAGERIESAFTLEIFNIDGNATVNLTTDIVLNISSKTLPITSKDVTPISAGSVGTIDRTLAEPFPLSSFPLEFGSQQTY